MRRRDSEDDREPEEAAGDPEPPKGGLTESRTGIVSSLRRPHVFEFQWHPDGPAYATTVRIEFAAHLQGTLVRLTERGFRDTPAGRRRQLDCAAGWGEALALCKIWVEHGVRY